jgi:hypothetical protein
MFMLKKTHELEIEIEQLKFKHLEERYGNLSEQFNGLLRQIAGRDVVIAAHSATINLLTHELVILRGVVKAPTEPEPPISHPSLMQADVEISSEVGLVDRQALLKEASEDFNRLISEIGAPKASPTAVAEATNIASDDEWKEQHRGPDDDSA